MRISSIDAIALIDANNFYASCEQNLNYPDFRFKNHIDVQIWGVVIYSIHSYL